MKGHLALDSEVGVGSTFSFIIPLPTPELPSCEIPEARPAFVDLQLLKVLLIEGNEINLKVGVRQLERQGCAVTTVPTGIDALELLSKSEFDLIVMDFEMTGMDSIRLIRDIRLREVGLRHTPIIVLTSNTSEIEQAQVLRAGADAYMSRPVQMLELKRFLEANAAG
jgi:CheY-like chemotaxis protein